MNTSESLGKISAALLSAQKAITFASKDATNPHFKNKYADLPAVIDAIKPALNEAEIAFIQSASPSDDSKLHLTTRLQHVSGEWIEDTLVMPLPKQDPQGYGSAMTYARRYALAAITGLYQDDDDGNMGSGVGEKPRANASPKAAPKRNESPPDDPADMATVEQMNAAESIQDLVKIMNALSKEQKAAVNETFNRRMGELKKAA